AGVDVHPVGDAEVLGGGRAGLAHEADGVGVVDHDQGADLVREVADAGQRGEVAVHREHAVGDDDGAPRTLAVVQRGGGLELGAQVVEIGVGVAAAGGLGQADPVDEGGVVQGV